MIDPRIYHQPTNQRLYHQPRAYPPGSGLLGNELIDFDFIKDREGFETKGYVPDPEGSQSGVTIASGFDLGQKNLNDLKGLPDHIIAKLKPFLGFKLKSKYGKNDISNQVAKLGFNSLEDYAASLKITEDEARIINNFAKTTETEKLIKRWNKDSKIPFKDLTKQQATVVASVAYQHGLGATTGYNFWKQTTGGDWGSAFKNLLDWDSTGEDSRYQPRKEEEAKYLFPLEFQYWKQRIK